MATRALPTDPDRPDVTRHELLSTSTAAASTPQAAFQVTTLADVVDASDGLLSLREAISEANATAGQDAITFAPALLGGTIELPLGTLVVTDDLTIDGDPGNGGPGGIVLDGATVYDDTGMPDGGLVSGAEIMFRTTGADLSLEDLTIVGTSVGVRATATDVALTRVEIAGERYNPLSALGVGVAILDGSLAVVDSAITDRGGDRMIGVFLDGSDISILRSTISVNSLGRYGTGAFLDGRGRVTVVDSTLADGGAVAPAFVTGDLTVRNSTVDINTDFGIEVIGSALFEFSTIRNTGIYDVGSGSFVVPDGSTLHLRNTIVDGEINGTVSSDGTNIFTASTADGAAPGDQLGVAPGTLFATGNLADNGGPTQTIALLDDATNPALDAADPADAPATDQRGLPRDATPDIGAFELQVQPGVELVVTTLDDVVDATDGQLSLREAIGIANAAAGGNEIGFAEAIRGGTITLTADLPTITDDLVIDGDPGNDGAGGIVIAGDYRIESNPHGTIESGARIVLETANVAVALEDLTIRGGETGIKADASALKLDRVAIDDNDQQSRLGGAGIGIDLSDGTLVVADSLVRGNQGESGAGIRFDTSQVEVIRSTISYNIGGVNFGHGLLGSGTLSVTDSTIGPNGRHFGISLEGDLKLVNSTLIYNGDPDSFGNPNGAIDLTGNGLILNSTITSNSGFAISLGDAATTARIENSIVDGEVDGTITSNGANVFTATGVNGIAPGDVVGVSTNGIFATGMLADNGGPTQTVALLDDPANPALDAADPTDAPPTDQRGFLRDATPDIGAFELGGGPVPSVPPLPPLAEKVPLADADILCAPRALFLVGPGGDAEIGFVDEYAAFQSSLGIYLIGSDGEILSTAWAFERVEHADASDLASNAARPGGGPLSPGDSLLLSALFDPAELEAGTEFGLFLVADGWSLNPGAVFEGGTLEFRSGGDAASVTDRAPDLVHIAADGVERLVLGDIMHTVDAGSPNPLSNALNPTGMGQVTSGLLDGLFTVAFEDKALAGSDRDFNDALFSVEVLDGGTEIAGAVNVQTLLTEAEVA